MSTVRSTRGATREGLLAQTRERTRSMLKFGVTTAEAKSGYGLELGSELDQLKVLLELDGRGPLEIAPTFLGAHAIPEEFKDDPDGYTSLLCDDMLPKVKEWWLKNSGGRPLPFVDIFCDEGAFNLEQTRRYLAAAKALGFALKIHSDEFANIGGTPLAIEMGAVSVDHLLHISPADIQALAKSDTIAIALPGTPFGLADPQYMPARDIIAADGLLAIASDFNPGTAWCENMQFVIALACRYLRLAPAEAIAAVTINSAAAIQRADRIGSIHPGKQADLLILSTPDYRHLGYRFGANVVDTVIKKGKVY
jgi:imidazolonepropionase